MNFNISNIFLLANTAFSGSSFLRIAYTTCAIIFSAIVGSQETLGHSGGLNSKGCHTSTTTGNYHCHKPNTDQQREPTLAISSNSEEKLNDLLANRLDGIRESRLNYQIPDTGETGHVIVDVQTKDLVIEGGLDKRSSLDSIQQALFAAAVTGKKPAVAIYDTDGVWGRYEYRIFIASKAAGVRFFWMQNGTVVQR